MAVQASAAATATAAAARANGASSESLQAAASAVASAQASIKAVDDGTLEGAASMVMASAHAVSSVIADVRFGHVQ